MSDDARPDNGHDETPPGTVFGREATRPRFVPEPDVEPESEPDPADDPAPEPDPAAESAAAGPEPEPELEPAAEPEAEEPEPEPEPEPTTEFAVAAAEPEPEPAGARAAAEREPVLVVATDDEPDEPDEPAGPEGLSALPDELAERWESAQMGFVDDPRLAVDNAARLTTEAFAAAERGWRDSGSSTEDLRVAFQRYRAVFSALVGLDRLTPRR